MESQKPRIELNAHEKVGEIDIYGQIGQSFWGDGIDPKQFKDDLDALGDLERLNVHIHSYGGFVYEGWAIFTALDNHKAETHIYVDGSAMSMASVILMAGDVRHIAKNGTIMIHDPMSCACGRAEDMQKEADHLIAIKEQILDVYAEKATISRGEISELMKAETFMNAEEALEKGFVDFIGEEIEIETEDESSNSAPMVAICAMADKTAIKKEAIMPNENQAEMSVEDQAALKNQGAEEANTRMKDILNLSRPGIEDFVKELAFSDASISDAKIQIANKLIEIADSAFEESKNSSNSPVPEEPVKEPVNNGTLQEQWDSNKNGVQDEFLNFEGFKAFSNANDQGLIKTLGGK